MGAFIESVEGVGDNAFPAPKVFTNQFITDIVKKSIDSGDLPLDHKLAMIGVVDEKGIRAIVSAQVMNKIVAGEHTVNIKIQSVVQHDWTGENKAGAQLLFSVR